MLPTLRESRFIRRQMRPVRLPPDDQPDCRNCGGSGEGAAPGMRCWECGGRGYVMEKKGGDD